MSLARALTKRVKRSDSTDGPARSPSKKSGQPILRAQISSPVALVSTTNMLSYNAPDISTMRHASSSSSSSASSRSSGGDSDFTTASEGTLTDASSLNSSPTSPKANYLNSYFPAPPISPRGSASSREMARPHRKSCSVDSVPAIPQRALSHSKRAHEQLARKRSIQNMSGPPSSLHSRQSSLSRECRMSADIFRSSIDAASHPFGKELEQLNEIAEEFGGAIRDVEIETDLARMQERGLGRYCAADYMMEIQPLFSDLFEIPPSPVAAGWI